MCLFYADEEEAFVPAEGDNNPGFFHNLVDCCRAVPTVMAACLKALIACCKQQEATEEEQQALMAAPDEDEADLVHVEAPEDNESRSTLLTCLCNTPGMLWAFTKNLIVNRYLLLLIALPLGYLASSSNFASCQEAVAALLTWINVALVIHSLEDFGGVSAEGTNFHSYFNALSNLTGDNVTIFFKQIASYYWDRYFLHRGFFGIIDLFIDTFILKPAGIFSAAGTAFIGYQALLQDGKPAVLKSIASFSANAAQSAAATGNLAVLVLRPFSIGNLIPIFRAMGDKVRELDEATLLQRCQMNREELCAYVDELLVFLNDDLEVRLNDARQYKDEPEVFASKINDIRAHIDNGMQDILGLYQRIYQQNETGLSTWRLWGRKILMCLVALNAVMLAFLNKDSTIGGLKALFDDNMTAVKSIFPLAFLARMSLFGMSSINLVILRLPEIFRSLKFMFKHSIPFFIVSFICLAFLSIVGAFSGFTFAHTIYTQHKDMDSTLLLGSVVVDAMVISAAINTNLLFGDTMGKLNEWFMSFLSWRRGDDAKVAVAQIKLATAFYSSATRLAGRFYRPLNGDDWSLAATAERLRDDMQRWDEHNTIPEAGNRLLTIAGASTNADNTDYIDIGSDPDEQANVPLTAAPQSFFNRRNNYRGTPSLSLCPFEFA